MRVMVFVKATEESERGVMPSSEALSAMMAYNEELVKAGVMLAADGLHPSSRGVRVAFSGREQRVIDGPFAETKELVAGYWLWQVRSLDEAVEWIKRSPFQAGEVELRPIFDPDDFGAALTPELRERGEQMRAETQSG